MICLGKINLIINKMEIKTLQELQEYTAQEVGYSNWHSLLKEVKQDAEVLDFYIDGVAIEFAKQFIDVAWEKAMVVEVEQDGDPISKPTDMFYIEPNRYMIVDKQSILYIKQLIK